MNSKLTNMLRDLRLDSEILDSEKTIACAQAKVAHIEDDIAGIKEAIQQLVGYWIICTVDDLIRLKDHYDNDELDSSESLKVLQVADLDLTGLLWAGIGTEKHPFRGSYDGNGHKITGLTFDATNIGDDLSKNNYNGLFRNVVDASIMNLEVTVAGFAFPDGYEFSNKYETRDALFDDEQAKVPNVLYVLNKEYEDCRRANSTTYIFYFDIAKNDFIAFTYGAAGIIGKAGVKSDTATSEKIILENVVVNGSIGTEQLPCSHNAAGIVVAAYGGPNREDTDSNIIFRNCTNNADVYCTYSKAAGIVAYNDSAAIEFTDVTNNGNITLYTYIANGGVGGFIGWFSTTHASYTKKQVTNCRNTGKIVDYDFKDIEGEYGSLVGQFSGNSINRTEFKTPFYGIPGYPFAYGSEKVTWLGKFVNDDEIELVNISDDYNFDDQKYMIASKYSSFSQVQPKLKVYGKQSFTLDRTLCEKGRGGKKLIIEHTGDGVLEETSISEYVSKYEWK